MTIESARSRVFNIPVNASDRNALAQVWQDLGPDIVAQDAHPTVKLVTQVAFYLGALAAMNRLYRSGQRSDMEQRMMAHMTLNEADTFFEILERQAGAGKV